MWTDDPTISAAIERLRDMMAQHGCYAASLNVTTGSAGLVLQGDASQMDARPTTSDWSDTREHYARSVEDGVAFVAVTRKVAS